MFFKRKPPLKRGEQARRFRRRKPTALQPFAARCRLPTGQTFEGACLDLGAGGASARFHLAQDPGLRIDDVVVLFVETLARVDGLEAAARIVYALPDGDGIVYGFEFVRAPGLMNGLARFFVRFFNRNLRRPVGTKPFDEIPIRVETEHDRFESLIEGISLESVDLILSGEEISRLEGCSRLELAFCLPDSDAVIHGPARMRGCSIRGGSWLVRFAFDLDAPHGVAQHTSSIEGYVFQRGERRDPRAA